MTTNTRTTLSATALGLVSFTATSAVLAGLFATPTVLGFALLAVYGVYEIAVLSYALPKPTTSARPAPAPVAVIRTTRRVPALIEFPVASRTACRSFAA